MVWEEAALGRRAAGRILDRLLSTHKGGLGLCMEDGCTGMGPSACAGRHANAFEAEELAESYDRFLLPMLPETLFQALVRADFASPAAAVVLCALFAGKPVSVPRTALYPETYGKAPVPPGLTQILAQKERKLQLLGIQIVDSNSISTNGNKQKAEEHPPKRILTEADILLLVSQGQSELILSKQDILTPLAADTAKEKKLLIVRGW